jgi:flagellar basal-body rod protein FlgC
MSVFDTIRIAASGLTAERLRMDVAASNLANAQTTRTQAASPAAVPGGSGRLPGPADGPDGRGPGSLRRRDRQAARPNTRVYDPTNPTPTQTGFVNYPNVDVASEMTDMMGAARSYQVNATVAQAAKQQALDALDLGKA